MDLIWADGFVGTRSNPGAHRCAKPLLLELLDQTLYTAVFLDQPVNHRHHLGTDGATNQSV